MPGVVKKDKVFEGFDPQKIFRSCIKAGAAEETAKEVAAAVEACEVPDDWKAEMRTNPVSYEDLRLPRLRFHLFVFGT